MSQSLMRILSQPQFVLPMLVWSAVWKGTALWKAANKRQFWWFVILFVFNTLGLLEIIYIFYLNRWDLDKGKTLIFLEKKFVNKKR